MAVGPVLGGCRGTAFLPEFSSGRRVRGLSGVSPTHVISCNYITLKVKIPTYKFQGDILQIIAIAICLHFGINYGIYFFMGMIRHAFAGTGKCGL